MWAADADGVSASLLIHDEILRSAIASRWLCVHHGGRASEISVPEVSSRAEDVAAHNEAVAGKASQRRA